jgi:Xaa-Pro aminopeptidase
MNLEAIQSAIREEGLDGWLFFDHHQRDPLAYRVLGVKPPSITSRRWYYFIPAQGEPAGLMHKIETSVLNGLPGRFSTYAKWEDQRAGIAGLLSGAQRVAMQYSPLCAIPLVSNVDAGTVELIRSLGVDVVSSANLIQMFEASWNQAQLDSHLEAGKLVDAIRADAFQLIGDRIRSGSPIREWDVQEYILGRFRQENLFADHGPNCSVNGNASDPHYDPKPDGSEEIKKGDTVLLDLWAKFDRPGAVYYDITWMAFCGNTAPAELENIFAIVRGARDRAIDRVRRAVESGQQVLAYQVDDAARGYIREMGYGEFFFHRTGHSIGTEVHGTGANMDNLETHDDRRIIPWTCFSVEPGIYLPKFGVRSEVNVFVDEHTARVTGEMQQAVALI